MTIAVPATNVEVAAPVRERAANLLCQESFTDFRRGRRAKSLGLTELPHRRRGPIAAGRTAAAPKQNFRQRFEKLEARREELLARLATLGDGAKQHPGYRRALTLLNASFRRASVTQRVSVLQAAEWLIDLLERLLFMGTPPLV